MQEMWELSPMERRYSVPPNGAPEIEAQGAGRGSTSEDLHAWSIYRQNLNSDFTDSALGSSEKSPLPYGNFQLRESTVHSIINHPRYGPKSELGTNMYTYLKFGLPRVLPPARAPRDGSSGYDSSDDGSPAMGNRNFKRARSDPDFRNQVILRQEVAGSVAWRERERRLKSSSEANLLSHDSYYRERDRTASRSASRMAQHDTYSDVGLVYQARRPASKAGSQLSMASRHSRASRATGMGMMAGGGAINGSYARGTPRLLPDKLVAKDGLLTPLPGEVEAVAFKHPHLQVRNLTYEITGGKVPRRLLDGISLEVRGGEILAAMATSEEEGTALLEVLSNHHSRWGTRLVGDLVLNGVPISPSKLGDRLAFVQKDHHFHTDLSVRQTMLFHALLQEPGASARARDTKGRISALIEDLGLGQVKHTRISDLTLSERQRLSVACHLLLDTELVLLDEPTRGMDIFDTFFLVEYLRQWAARGRAVVVTIHPPTYEIFTMVSKVALISTGRLMYYGRRREMLPYFAFIEYPCPAYKNPSDYYLDLVTLDTLSAEAMLESSQRIEQLAETFRRRQEPLSETGPPSPLPPRIKRAGALGQVLALWIRAMIYAFPFNVIRWVQMVLLAGSLSVIVGAIFWGMRGMESPQQQNVNDRFGFYYSLLALAPWPLLLAAVARVRSMRPALLHDLRHRLYSRLWYFVAHFTYSFPATGALFLAYLVPAYAMAGLQTDEREVLNFYTYIGYTVLYMYAVHSVLVAMSHLVPWPHVSALLGGLVLLCSALASGYSVHLRDLGFWCAWLRLASPLHWVLHPLARAEFRHVSYFACPRNPVVKQDNTILVQVECGVKDGPAALAFLELGHEASPLASQPFLPATATLAFALAFSLLGLVAFLVFRGRAKKDARL